MTGPLRVVLAGAGGFGRRWLGVLEASAEVQLCGVADLDVAVARAAADATGRPGLPVGADAVALARQVGAQALINVTTPAAHHPVATAAMVAGLPVLSEKPLAETVAQGLSLAAASEVTGQLLMISQSRRWNPRLDRLRQMSERLGRIGSVTTTFARRERFGGFREVMAQPLLVDMAVHAFDSARFLLRAEPVSVYCQTYNPAWSWFAGDANAVAVFEMDNGARYLYDGTWVTPGATTSWNGEWRVGGEHGTARWDGDHDPVLDAEVAAPDSPPRPYSDVEGSLQVFVRALRTGVVPEGEVHENLMSLAMVEAAVRSAAAGAVVRLDDVLARAHEQALRDETRDDVRARLAELAPG